MDETRPHPLMNLVTSSFLIVLSQHILVQLMINCLLASANVYTHTHTHTHTHTDIKPLEEEPEMDDIYDDTVTVLQSTK